MSSLSTIMKDGSGAMSGTIFSFLDLPSLSNCLSVNKEWREAASREKVWAPLFAERPPRIRAQFPGGDSLARFQGCDKVLTVGGLINKIALLCQTRAFSERLYINILFISPKTSYIRWRIDPLGQPHSSSRHNLIYLAQITDPNDSIGDMVNYHEDNLMYHLPREALHLIPQLLAQEEAFAPPPPPPLSSKDDPAALPMLALAAVAGAVYLAYQII